MGWKEEIRCFCRGREVRWEEMRMILDRRDAAFWGGNGCLLLEKGGIECVRRIVRFLLEEGGAEDVPM